MEALFLQICSGSWATAAVTHLTNTRTRASSAALDASVRPFALRSCSLPQREGVHFHAIFEHCYNTNVAAAAVAAGAGVGTAGERGGNWTSGSYCDSRTFE